MKTLSRSIALFALPFILGNSTAETRPSLNAEQVAWLKSHNEERIALGVPPLQWDRGLAQDAQSWANQMARTRQFEHAPQKGDESDQGENLWMGTAGRFAPHEMVNGWIEEKKDFVRGPFPKVSKTGKWADVGHYVQLVWADTQKVGCAKSTAAGDDYLVCRYYPAGNWEGQDPFTQYAKAEQSVHK